jgi:hypothetical protein
VQQPVLSSDTSNVQETKPTGTVAGMPDVIFNSGQLANMTYFDVALIGLVKDDSVKNLMMAWYWAGYYTGYHEGEKAAKQSLS